MRKEIIKYFVLIALFISLIKDAYCDSNRLPQDLIDSIKISHIEPNNKIESDAKLYQLLYENEKKHSENLTSTMQWTIGISVAFILAIFGSQLYFNWRINKKEIEYIHKDFEEKVSQFRLQFTNELNESIRQQTDLTNTTFETVKKEFKDFIDHEFEQNTKLSEAAAKLLQSDIQRISTTLDYKIKDLQTNIEKTEGDIWKLKGVESNALTNYLKTALLELELNRELKYTLDYIIEILEQIQEIHEFDYERLIQLTVKLPSKYELQKNKIKTLFEGKPAYKFSEVSAGTKDFPFKRNYSVFYTRNPPNNAIIDILRNVNINKQSD